MSSNRVPRAWVRLLRAHTALTRDMDARLREGHGLTLREYEVLLSLHEADGHRLRRVDLAAQVLLTQGGVTRLLDPLERQGLVGRAPCETDRRVTYAVLTEEGRERFRAAARTHRRDIRELFTVHYDETDLEKLDELLARLPGAAGDLDWAA